MAEAPVVNESPATSPSQDAPCSRCAPTCARGAYRLPSGTTTEPSSSHATRGRLGPMSVRLLVKRSAAKAGVKATTHVLRRSCATHLLAGGADVRHVQELLGHKDLATTALYTKVDTHGLAQVLRAATRGRR
jgi:integrase